LKIPLISIFTLILCFGLVSCSQGGFTAGELVVVSTKLLPTKTSTPVISSTITTTPSPTPTLTITPSPVPITPTPTECGEQQGRVEINQIPTFRLSKPMDYRVYTPPCYSVYLEKRYPVIYLFHGYGSNDDQWDRLGIDEAADKLIVSGEIPSVIIVMPYDRNHNLYPPQSGFGEVVSKELIPIVDSNYRTMASRQFRAVGGLSRGGNWSIHLGLTDWKLFSKVGAHSAPLFVTDGPLQIKNLLDQIPPDSYPHFYQDAGERDKLLQQIVDFEEILDEYNVPHEIHIFPGDHTDEYWSSHIEAYLRWYTSNWEIDP
jgi:enterochelin esterase-like enzyme